jgi:hypothetical protein
LISIRLISVRLISIRLISGRLISVRLISVRLISGRWIERNSLYFSGRFSAQLRLIALRLDRCGSSQQLRILIGLDGRLLRNAIERDGRGLRRRSLQRGWNGNHLGRDRWLR